MPPRESLRPTPRAEANEHVRPERSRRGRFRSTKRGRCRPTVGISGRRGSAVGRLRSTRTSAGPMPPTTGIASPTGGTLRAKPTTGGWLATTAGWWRESSHPNGCWRSATAPVANSPVALHLTGLLGIGRRRITRGPAAARAMKRLPATTGMSIGPPMTGPASSTASSAWQTPPTSVLAASSLSGQGQPRQGRSGQNRTSPRRRTPGMTPPRRRTPAGRPGASGPQRPRGCGWLSASPRRRPSDRQHLGAAPERDRSASHGADHRSWRGIWPLLESARLGGEPASARAIRLQTRSSGAVGSAPRHRPAARGDDQLARGGSRHAPGSLSRASRSGRLASSTHVSR